MLPDGRNSEKRRLRATCLQVLLCLQSCWLRFVVSARFCLVMFAGVCLSQLAVTSACRMVRNAAFDIASVVFDVSSRS